MTRAWLAAGSMLAISFAAVATMTLHAHPEAEAVAAVFPPWWSRQQSVIAAASAGASIIRTSSIPAIVVVQPAQDGGIARLRAAGAWMAIDPQALDGCISDSKTLRSEGLRT